MALKKWLFTEEEPKKENNDPVSGLVIEDNSAMTEDRKSTGDGDGCHYAEGY